MTEQFLPVGIQNFEQMVAGNFVYVDKTRFIYRMAKPPQGFYFLARPRRFGKSLTVSTLDCLFQGRRDLFEGLYIDGTDFPWKRHPVFKIDFNTVNYSTPRRLEESLLYHLHRFGAEHGIDNAVHSLPDCFSVTLVDLHKKCREKVAVLVDEYDKPIIEHLGAGDGRLSFARENRDLLKQFFGALKGGDVSAALRFVFVTGVSKFAHVSIFSDLNNLNDISMHRRYGEIAGYTSGELTGRFEKRLDRMAAEMQMDRDAFMETVRKWYNGYRFTASSEPVYNPFSILRLLESGEFKNHWFETATPTFLTNLVREKNYPAAEIENLKLPEEAFSIYDLERLQIEPLLFQTGYITIDRFENDLYSMKYPNREVKASFADCLLKDIAGPENTRMAAVYKTLHLRLREMNTAEFIEGARAVLAAVPYPQIAARKDEAYYHTVFYLMLSASGLPVQSEVLCSRGRMDMVVEFADKVFVIELKCNQNSERAVRQILEKRYYEKYLSAGKKIYLMGINFDTDKRTIDDWRCVELDECREQLAGN